VPRRERNIATIAADAFARVNVRVRARHAEWVRAKSLTIVISTGPGATSSVARPSASVSVVRPLTTICACGTGIVVGPDDDLETGGDRFLRGAQIDREQDREKMGAGEPNPTTTKHESRER